MVWQKISIAILLFYVAVLLQTSFFSYFALFGANPDLVFIIFFLLAFFEKKSAYFSSFILGLSAGFFLDIFSAANLGPSIVLLGIFGLLIKKTQNLLQNSSDNYPFLYFAPLFAIFLAAYKFLLAFATKMPSDMVFSIIYDIILAAVLFYFYKKYFNPEDNRQLSLFNK